jgi:serine/threonine-protein kinase
MAPEQATGEKSIDERADIFSLGMISFYTLTGILPTQADHIGQVIKLLLTRAIPPLETILPDVPGDVAQLVNRMLSMDPTRRPAAADVAQVLSQYVGHTLAAAPTPAHRAAPSAPDEGLAVAPTLLERRPPPRATDRQASAVAPTRRTQSAESSASGVVSAEVPQANAARSPTAMGTSRAAGAARAALVAAVAAIGVWAAVGRSTPAQVAPARALPPLVTSSMPASTTADAVTVDTDRSAPDAGSLASAQPPPMAVPSSRIRPAPVGAPASGASTAPSASVTGPRTMPTRLQENVVGKPPF